MVDDLWRLGKPRGIGGPWKNTEVKAGEPSDPYVMTAYDRKQVNLTGEVLRRRIPDARLVDLGRDDAPEAPPGPR